MPDKHDQLETINPTIEEEDEQTKSGQTASEQTTKTRTADASTIDEVAQYLVEETEAFDELRDVPEPVVKACAKTIDATRNAPTETEKAAAQTDVNQVKEKHEKEIQEALDVVDADVEVNVDDLLTHATEPDEFARDATQEEMQTETPEEIFGTENNTETLHEAVQNRIGDRKEELEEEVQEGNFSDDEIVEKDETDEGINPHEVDDLDEIADLQEVDEKTKEEKIEEVKDEIYDPRDIDEVAEATKGRKAATVRDALRDLGLDMEEATEIAGTANKKGVEEMVGETEEEQEKQEEKEEDQGWFGAAKDALTRGTLSGALGAGTAYEEAQNVIKGVFGGAETEEDVENAIENFEKDKLNNAAEMSDEVDVEELEQMSGDFADLEAPAMEFEEGSVQINDIDGMSTDIEAKKVMENIDDREALESYLEAAAPETDQKTIEKFAKELQQLSEEEQEEICKNLAKFGAITGSTIGGGTLGGMLGSMVASNGLNAVTGGIGGTLLAAVTSKGMSNYFDENFAEHFDEQLKEKAEELGPDASAEELEAVKEELGLIDKASLGASAAWNTTCSAVKDAGGYFSNMMSSVGGALTSMKDKASEKIKEDGLVQALKDSKDSIKEALNDLDKEDLKKLGGAGLKVGGGIAVASAIGMVMGPMGASASISSITDAVEDVHEVFGPEELQAAAEAAEEAGIEEDVQQSIEEAGETTGGAEPDIDDVMNPDTADQAEMFNNHMEHLVEEEGMTESEAFDKLLQENSEQELRNALGDERVDELIEEDVTTTTTTTEDGEVVSQETGDFVEGNGTFQVDTDGDGLETGGPSESAQEASRGAAEETTEAEETVSQETGNYTDNGTFQVDTDGDGLEVEEGEATEEAGTETDGDDTVDDKTDDGTEAQEKLGDTRYNVINDEFTEDKTFEEALVDATSEYTAEDTEQFLEEAIERGEFEESDMTEEEIFEKFEKSKKAVEAFEVMAEAPSEEVGLENVARSKGAEEIMAYYQMEEGLSEEAVQEKLEKANELLEKREEVLGLTGVGVTQLEDSVGHEIAEAQPVGEEIEKDDMRELLRRANTGAGPNYGPDDVEVGTMDDGDRYLTVPKEAETTSTETATSPTETAESTTTESEAGVEEGETEATQESDTSTDEEQVSESEQQEGSGEVENDTSEEQQQEEANEAAEEQQEQEQEQSINFDELDVSREEAIDMDETFDPDNVEQSVISMQSTHGAEKVEEYLTELEGFDAESVEGLTEDASNAIEGSRILSSTADTNAALEEIAALEDGTEKLRDTLEMTTDLSDEQIDGQIAKAQYMQEAGQRVDGISGAEVYELEGQVDGQITDAVEVGDRATVDAYQEDISSTERSEYRPIQQDGQEYLVRTSS